MLKLHTVVRVRLNDWKVEEFSSLMRVAGEIGARNLLLLWGKSVFRLAAQWRASPQTGTSLKSQSVFFEHDRIGLIQLSRLYSQFRRHKWPLETIELEDLATERNALQSVVPSSLWDRFEREAFWTPPTKLLPQLLKPKISVDAASAEISPLVRLNPLPQFLYEGDEISLQGFVVPLNNPPPHQLALHHEGRVRKVPWPFSSKAFARRFPDVVGSDCARFTPQAITVHSRSPTQLCVRTNAKSKLQALATLNFVPHSGERIPGILLAAASVGYQPLPKVACTSIKEALFRLAFKQPYAPDLGEGAPHVHSYFDLRVCDVGLADWKFTVVRDPIQRFLSGYSNRVRHHRELSEPYLSQLKLDPALDLHDFPFDPDIHEFIKRFDLYLQVPTIRHHFRPVSEILAPLAAYDKVYAFESLDDLSADLSRKVGQPVVFPHSQRGGKKVSIGDLRPGEVEKLVGIFGSDYDLLSAYYPRPSRSA
jgi:hypothetical protein